MAGIPERVKRMVELPPVEDLMLKVLREAFPDVPVYSLIPDVADPFPFILVRNRYGTNQWSGDERFLDSGLIDIHTFTQDPNGDQEGAQLSEAVRVALRDAGRARKVYPGLGTLVAVKMTSKPRRVTDWATASGPVQYADLPTGTWRYETVYRVTYRKPNS